MTSKSSLQTFLGATLLGAALLAGPALADDKTGWQEIPRPDVGKGLMMEPHLLGNGSRMNLVWSGTSPKVPKPEVFYTSISGSSTVWSNPRAPFFGSNKSRVRKVGIGRSRNLMAIIFERTLTQGTDAYEVMVSLSSDQGWSWSKPIELDSFAAEKSGGTWVGVEGREGPNRTEFAMAWVRDYGNIRVANMDFKESVRPQGTVVGQHIEGAMKAGVAALGKDGFSVVYNNGVGLATAHARALVGKVSEGVVFLRGRYGNFFTVASRPYGPSRMAAADGDKIMAFTSQETSWKNDQQNGKLPFSASNISAESDMDENQDLHVAMLVPKDKGFEVWYIGQKNKVWGEAQLVTKLEKDVDVRGYDVGATDDYVFITASQGFEAKFYRMKKG